MGFSDTTTAFFGDFGMLRNSTPLFVRSVSVIRSGRVRNVVGVDARSRGMRFWRCGGTARLYGLEIFRSAVDARHLGVYGSVMSMRGTVINFV
jgi:hypothetical protein